MLSLVSSGADIAFYTERIRKAPSDVLILGGGSLPLIWAVASAASAVQVVDMSQSVVDAVEKSKVEQPPDLAGRVQAVASDLRAYRAARPFLWVIAPQNALGLVGVSDIEPVLAAIRACLRPDGLFAFDVSSPPNESPRPLADIAPPRSVAPRRPVFAPHLRERKVAGGQGPIHRLLFRPFSAEELDRALKEAGFTLLECYGDFRGKPFDARDPMQVRVAAPS